MPWVQIQIATTAAQADALSETLNLAGAAAVTFIDGADEAIFEPALGTTPFWNSTRVIGLFEADQDIELTLRLLRLHHGEKALLHYKVEAVEDKDWNRCWMDNFQPLQMGQRLWICPSWRDLPDPNAVNVLLDPGLAFGTGSHPTTSMCLEWLEAHPPLQQQIIDYGCGSGILAIAALKLGATAAIAIDNDPQALEATLENARRNQVEQYLSCYYPQHVVPQQADTLIANILAKPLIELSEQLAQLVKPAGHIALSGILDKQAAAVIEAYQPWFQLSLTQTKEEWVLLTGQRLITSQCQESSDETTAYSAPWTQGHTPLHRHVQATLQHYFNQLDGQIPSNLYEMVMAEVEMPLLQTVLAQTLGNLSKAAHLLGISRATLRKKLKHYKLG